MIAALASWLQNVMLALGYGVCHQLPERSFIEGGLQQPVCARCSGIYVGAIIGLALLFWLYRRGRAGQARSASESAEGSAQASAEARLQTDAQAGASGPAPSSETGKLHFGVHWTYWVFLALALVAMGYDGFSSYLGFRPTTDLIRLVTGLAVGGGLAPLLFVLLGETLLRSPAQKTVLARPRDWALYLAALVAGGAIEYPLGQFLGPVVPLLVTFCLVATYTAVALVLVGLVRRFEHRVACLRDAVIPVLIACVVALVLLMFFALLKVVLLSLLV